MSNQPSTDIQSSLNEKRLFPPPADFSATAHVPSITDYERLYEEADRDPEKFWGAIAGQLEWFKPWTKVLDWSDAPFAKWFVGGKLNLSHNCLDRHLTTWRKNKAALIWEGEPGEIRTLTYQQLHSEVCRFANVLKSLGVKTGDRVAIYMGTSPELATAVLACARIGAPHTVIFGGFSAQAITDRIHDSQASCVITQDGTYRRGAEIKLKPTVDTAQSRSARRSTALSFSSAPARRRRWSTAATTGGTSAWLTPPTNAPPNISIPSIRSISSTPPAPLANPKASSTRRAATRLAPTSPANGCSICATKTSSGALPISAGSRATAISSSTARCRNGATVLMYEGGPVYPQPDRFWDMIDRHKVTVFYTAPTAIRAFMRLGEQWPAKHPMKSLRLLGSVGEPINPEAWMWYRSVIGRNNCPIVDTWWQTETGGIMISPLPGATATKPGSCTRPLPGVKVEVVTREGTPVPAGSGRPIW